MPRSKRKSQGLPTVAPRKSARKSDPPARLGYDEQQQAHNVKQPRALHRLQLPFRTDGLESISSTVEQYNKLLQVVPVENVGEWRVGETSQKVREAVKAVNHAVRLLQTEEEHVHQQKRSLEVQVGSLQHWYAKSLPAELAELIIEATLEAEDIPLQCQITEENADSPTGKKLLPEYRLCERCGEEMNSRLS